MTEALRQMVKAMCEEFVRQAQEDRASSGYASPIATRAHEITLDGLFDLEKVARAGLQALKQPPEAVTTEMHQKAWLQDDLHRAYQAVFDAAIDEILA